MIIRNINNLVIGLIATMVTAILIGIFVLLTVAVFWLFGVEPGAFERVRPWIGIACCWCVYGFIVRVGTGYASEGMISTPGIWSALSIVGWPVYAWLLMFG